MAKRQQFDTVPELSISEAAEILELDRRTVKKLIEQAVLSARIASPPTSKRPRYRIPADEVIGLRNSYHRNSTTWRGERKKVIHRRSAGQFSHIKLKLP